MLQKLISPDSNNLSNFALYQISSIIRNKHQTALGHINALVQYILTFCWVMSSNIWSWRELFTHFTSLGCKDPTISQNRRVVNLAGLTVPSNGQKFLSIFLIPTHNDLDQLSGCK